jgi:hypothetical protein
MMKSMTLITQALEAGYDRDPKILALINCLIGNPNNNEKAALLERLIAPKMVIQKLFGKPFRDPEETVDGQIKFAVTEHGLPVGFNPEDPHCLIAGQTGSGKSVVQVLMLGQAIQQGSKVWLFTKADDTRILLRFSRDILIEDFSND